MKNMSVSMSVRRSVMSSHSSSHRRWPHMYMSSATENTARWKGRSEIAACAFAHWSKWPTLSRVSGSVHTSDRRRALADAYSRWCLCQYPKKLRVVVPAHASTNSDTITWTPPSMDCISSANVNKSDAFGKLHNTGSCVGHPRQLVRQQILGARQFVHHAVVGQNLRQ